MQSSTRHSISASNIHNINTNSTSSSTFIIRTNGQAIQQSMNNNLNTINTINQSNNGLNSNYV
jgi:hypothetical protein